MNVKGGVDYDEFAAYIMNLIVPLYLYDREDKGKFFSFMADSGPGKINLELLSNLYHLFLFPRLLNSIIITQEMDCNYALFKTRFFNSLYTKS